MTDSKNPNFFIVGAARSGTTTLWQHLKRHPEIYMPHDELHKEPAFFSNKGEGRGLEGYLDLFKDAGADHKIIGEASTAYLTDPISAQKIYDFNPQSKIIISLRNPADRAYSLYRWMTQDGYEYAETFEEALELEKQRSEKHIPNWLEPEYYWNYMYFKSGLYSTQIQRYVNLFGDNVLIIHFENIITDFKNTYQKICEFLDIQKFTTTEKKHNESKKIYSPQVQFILRKTTQDLMTLFRKDSKNIHIVKEIPRLYLKNAKEFYRQTGKVVSIKFSWLIYKKLKCKIAKEKNFKYNPLQTKEERDFLLHLGTEIGKPPGINNETRKQLLSSYTEDVSKLEILLNRSFTHWVSTR